MSNNTASVSVTILDKSYLIACEEHETEQLRLAVDYINQKMHEVKQDGGLIGGERIAVMAALNIANEMLGYKNEKEGYTIGIEETVQRLHNKIDHALTNNHWDKTYGERNN